MWMTKMSVSYRFVVLQYYWHAFSLYVFYVTSCNNNQLQCLFLYRHLGSQQEHIIAGINITLKNFYDTSKFWNPCHCIFVKQWWVLFYKCRLILLYWISIYIEVKWNNFIPTNEIIQTVQFLSYKHYWETEHAPKWGVVAKLLLKSAKIKMSFW